MFILGLSCSVALGWVACKDKVAGDRGEQPAARTQPGQPDPGEAPSEGIHWGYEGASGPDRWASLGPDYALCGTGKAQSPIDLPETVPATEAAIEFDYRESALHVHDIGHTLQVNYGPGSTVTIDGTTYALRQFHFHHPSEHTVAGKPTAMVAHLVHSSQDGKPAVIGVLLDQGDGAHPLIETVWKHMPGPSGSADPAGVRISIAELLPEDRAYYRYQGSLTTPPCTEGVLWSMLRAPVAVSAEQVAAFARRYPNNARGVQPLQGRAITGGPRQ